MRLSKRDLTILAACVIALGAFRPETGLTSDSDIGHLSVDELDRGEELLETMSAADVAAALKSVEADLASVTGGAS